MGKLIDAEKFEQFISDNTDHFEISSMDIDACYVPRDDLIDAINSGSLDADMSKLVIMSTVNDPKSFEPSPDSGSVPLDAPAAADLPGGLLDSLKRIAEMKDRDGNVIDMTAQELQGIARRAIACHEATSASAAAEGWIPVAERLPDDGQRIYYWFNERTWAGWYCAMSNAFFNANRTGFLHVSDVTLWSPRHEPQPPTTRAAGGGG